MSTIMLILLVIVAFELCGALFLWLAARWFRIAGTSYVKALATVLALTIISLLLDLVFRITEPWAAPAKFIWWLLKLLSGLTISWLVIQKIFQTSLPKAMLVWLSILAAAGANFALVLLVIKPFLLEPFIMPTNSMAPTLVGPHQFGMCPHCGKAMIIPYHGEFAWNHRQLPQEQLGICASCLNTAMIGAKSPNVHSGDCFFENKLIFPRRWDLVVYRTPADPSLRYVKRLVGLPGEEVVIKEGAIWINGRKMNPPQELAALRFAAAPQGYPQDPWGSPTRPARLGADEFFIVGDFSEQSADSRIGGIAAEGHPPYALPRSHIDGVATLIYWPPSRWRMLR